MGENPGAVIPKERDNNLEIVGNSAVTKCVVEDKSSLHQRLLDAAICYLREAGINIPHSHLQVKGHEVVMHGAPQGGPVLVCAWEKQKIKVYI